MEKATARDVTRLLREFRAGDAQAQHRLVPLIYQELRERAAGQLRDERAGHTLQPTALANEAWMRLADLESMEFSDRRHFFAVAATCIRRILVDHARRRGARRRSAGGERVPLTGLELGTGVDPNEILDLDAALERFAALSARKARVVELRYFGGMSNEEVAESLELSVGTVERDLRIARAWLQRELSEGGPE